MRSRSRSNGVNTPCNYTQAAEISASLNRLLLTQRNNSTPFVVHSDSAPNIYVTGNPGPTDAATRITARDLWQNARFAVKHSR